MCRVVEIEWKNKSAKSFNPFTLLSAFDIYEFKKKLKFKNQNYKFKDKSFTQALILGPGKSPRPRTPSPAFRVLGLGK